jgi:hypothetical protein
MAPTKWRTGSDGAMEEVDLETGEVVTREKRKTRVNKKGEVTVARRGRKAKVDLNTHHYIRDQRGRKIWVPKGTDPSHIKRTVWPFNVVTCDLIAEQIMEGLTIKEIGELEGFPPASTITGWLYSGRFPEFAAQVKAARKARAEIYADEVIGIAKTTTKDTVLEDRLKSELYKWGAEVGNPDEFGKRTKVTGDAHQPIAFLIDTGIRRAEESASVVQIPADGALSGPSSAGNAEEDS